MRALLTFFSLVLLAPLLTAQTAEESYEAKLAEPFVAKVPWVREFDEARRRARAEDKLILAWFTRSYEPCAASAAYERGPLVSDWWPDVARGFVPYLNVSARLDDKPDQGLVIEKGGAYFPYCVLMDGRGRVLVELRPITRRAIELAGEEGRLHARLLVAADDPKDQAAARALRLYRAIRGDVRLGDSAMADIRNEPEQDKELVERYDDFLRRRQVRKAFREAQDKVREVPRPGEDGAEARAAYRAAQEAVLAAEIYRLFKSGVDFRMEANPAMYLNYVILATRGAVAQKDRATAESGLAKLEAAEAAFVPASSAPLADGDTGFGDRATFRRKIRFEELQRSVKALPAR